MKSGSKEKLAFFKSPSGLSMRSILSSALRRLWARLVVEARTMLRCTKSSIREISSCCFSYCFMRISYSAAFSSI
ncbi:hypothetical protein D3C86_2001170 [compost metagenome]